MRNFQDRMSEQLQTVLSKLLEVEGREADLLKRFKLCLQLCHDQMNTWRQSVQAHGFLDEDGEIWFFKHIKPQVAGRYLYYQRVLQLHLDTWKGAAVNQEQRLVKEMNYVEQVFEQNRSLWQYYQSGDTSLDRGYFLRGQESWLYPIGHYHFDDSFSTRSDGPLAALLSMEFYSDYIGRRLAGDDSAATIRQPITPGALQCTAPAAHATVLGVALHRIRFFNQGRVTKTTVMNDFQRNWNINLTNHSQIIDQVKRQHEPDRFLRDLLDEFNNFIDDK